MPLRTIISLPRSYTRDGRMISPRAERLPFPFPLSLCVDVHVSRSLHRGPRYNRACIWQYLTCFRKRSLVTEMRSRSDNSYVEYYTVEELPLVPYRASDARPPAHARCAPVSNFRIIRPLSAIRQFRQFRNGTWECGATVGGGGERIPLANDVKVRSVRTRRIWGHRNFSLSPTHARATNLALRCVHKQKLHVRILYIPVVRGSIPRGLPVKRCNQL